MLDTVNFTWQMATVSVFLIEFGFCQQGCLVIEGENAAVRRQPPLIISLLVADDSDAQT